MLSFPLLLYNLMLSVSRHDPPQSNNIQIDLQESVPSGASRSIDHAYPGFAIAVHAFQEYAGNLSYPNSFSKNLIDTIANKTGTNVHIRIGGTSGDNAHYVSTQNVSLQLPPGAVPGGIPAGITLGPAWFEGFASFPRVQWMYMAHLAVNGTDAEANAVAATAEALKYIGSNLEAIEVGNEVDLYHGHVRPAEYSVEDYIHEWMNYTSAISYQVLAGSEYENETRIYQAPVYADRNVPWVISNIFDLGIDINHNIKSSALHHYQETCNCSTTITRQRSFMNHTAIVQNLTYFSEPAAYLSSLDPLLPLYLAEFNSDTYSTNNTDYIGVFGSALWLVDSLMYLMTRNVSRVNVQLSTGFEYTSWRPVEYYGKPPAVLPPWYAQVFIADTIGSNASNEIRVQDLGLGLDLFSAYSIYNNDSLNKVVLVNLEEWNTTTPYPRPLKTVQLSVPEDATEWKVERLYAPGADSLTNITWAGVEWTYESNGLGVQVASDIDYLQARDGRLDMFVQASQAILVSKCK